MARRATVDGDNMRYELAIAGERLEMALELLNSVAGRRPVNIRDWYEMAVELYPLLYEARTNIAEAERIRREGSPKRTAALERESRKRLSQRQAVNGGQGGVAEND